MLLALAPFSLGTAQTQRAAGNPGGAQAGSEPTATFRTNANLVLVDVVVRDKGKPVLGLTESDFHVQEDGHEQKVTIFEEHKASDATEASRTLALPPHMYSNSPRYQLTSAANVLLLDSLNTPQQQQNWVRQRMDKYLGNVPPGTQIALFTLGSKLQMVTGFTADAGMIERALNSSQTQPQMTGAMDTTFDRATQAMSDQVVQNNNNLDVGTPGAMTNNTPPVAGITVAQRMEDFAADSQGFEMDTRVRFTLAALEELGRYLGAIPGRKNLIWFSGAFPISFDPNPSGLDLGEYRNYNTEVREIGAMFARGRVAVYPVDGRGVDLMPAENSTQTDAVLPGTTVPVGTTMADTTNNNMTMMESTGGEHLGMRDIARDTGGEAFIDTNSVGQAVAKAIDDGSNYYTVGYVPTDKNYNGDYRKIDVKLDKGHDSLSYRRGYFADDPNKPATGVPNLSPITTAMVHGAPPLSQIVFDVRVLPAGDPALGAEKPSSQPAGEMVKDLKGPARRETVDYYIDPRNVDYRTLPDGRHQLEFEVTQAVYDAGGHRLNFTDLGGEMDLTPEQDAAAQEHGLHFHQEIDVPASQVWLRLGVEDKLSGRIGTLEIPLAAETKQIAAQR